MAMRLQQGASGIHPYGPSVPRAGLVPGAAAALEQARRRQDAKNRRRLKKKMVLSVCQNNTIRCISLSTKYIALRRYCSPTNIFSQNGNF